jgi:hypothetical protein
MMTRRIRNPSKSVEDLCAFEGINEENEKAVQTIEYREQIVPNG